MSAARKPLPEVTQPPEGVRLCASVIAASMGISMNEMAQVAGVSKTAMFSIVVENRWPVRADCDLIRTALRELFEQRGATEEQLRVLFHQHLARRMAEIPKTDSVGRDPNRPPKEEEPTDMLLPKQTLSQAARQQFEMFTNPFDGEVESAEQMFTNGEIRFVREACWQAATNARFVAVVGESGAGKTTLLADLKERIATDGKNIKVLEPSVVGMEDTNTKGRAVKAGDLLTAIILDISPTAKVAVSMERRKRQAFDLLAESTTAGHRHLVLIEEGHSLPKNTLRHLKRLHEAMRLRGRKPMLGILILGQPELKTRLMDSSHELREVVQRLELVELQPLDNDLKAYLAHRAKAAGKKLGELIDDAGVEAIRERLTVLKPGVRNAAISLLYPLAVNNMVTACLNTAARLGAPLVTRDVVRAV